MFIFLFILGNQFVLYCITLMRSLQFVELPNTVIFDMNQCFGHLCCYAQQTGHNRHNVKVFYIASSYIQKTITCDYIRSGAHILLEQNNSKSTGHILNFQPYLKLIKKFEPNRWMDGWSSQKSNQFIF